MIPGDRRKRTVFQVVDCFSFVCNQWKSERKMSVIGKKLNPIQSGGHGDDTSDTDNTKNVTIKPDDVLRLNAITTDYLCKPGEEFPLKFIIFPL